eukprot:TRINITY_DN80517_c0_g1_i1.p1 TRINITY_DN80517_c0_g1~~TRINITY_DN80517_c0_g1_i1.p1  ORF type:complete len:573 (+),score=65.11 TRINITY_DN80517_c0_g1_i1:151-1719(+)
MRRGHRKKLQRPKRDKAALWAEIQGQGKEVSRGRSVFKRSVNMDKTNGYIRFCRKERLREQKTIHRCRTGFFRDVLSDTLEALSECQADQVRNFEEDGMSDDALFAACWTRNAKKSNHKRATETSRRLFVQPVSKEVRFVASNLPVVEGFEKSPNEGRAMTADVTVSSCVLDPNTMSDVEWTIGIATLNGEMIVESLAVRPCDFTQFLQLRVLELVGIRYVLVTPTGTVVAPHPSMTIEAIGIQDGDVLTAINPITAAGSRNQLSFRDRVQADHRRLKSLLEDEQRFERLVRLKFKLLTTKRLSSKPCTDLANQLRNNVDLAPLAQWTVLGVMAGERDDGRCYLNEEGFSKFMEGIVKHTLACLEASLLREEASREAWLRKELQQSISGFYDLRVNFGHQVRSGHRRIRLWRHNACCQMVGKSDYGDLILHDGSFEIKGDSLAFEWSRMFSCSTSVTHAKWHTIVSRSSPWRPEKEWTDCGLTHISLFLCSPSDGLSAKNQVEIEEIGAALNAFAIPNCGGF